eukprot:TRINITY_DN18434_c0_g3_i1.p1 TRINITY_DN18434_c0_g3~~TRINITY_DN18434_c0_g3_i1.p1  ORF type:complete len:473 (+),score=79.81 TRINITY_DN18434_c0_g3_i1:95-1513(+)
MADMEFGARVSQLGAATCALASSALVAAAAAAGRAAETLESRWSGAAHALVPVAVIIVSASCSKAYALRRASLAAPAEALPAAPVAAAGAAAAPRAAAPPAAPAVAPAEAAAAAAETPSHYPAAGAGESSAPEPAAPPEPAEWAALRLACSSRRGAPPPRQTERAFCGSASRPASPPTPRDSPPPAPGQHTAEGADAAAPQLADAETQCAAELPPAPLLADASTQSTRAALAEAGTQSAPPAPLADAATQCDSAPSSPAASQRVPAAALHSPLRSPPGARRRSRGGEAEEVRPQLPEREELGDGSASSPRRASPRPQQQHGSGRRCSSTRPHRPPWRGCGVALEQLSPSSPGSSSAERRFPTAPAAQQRRRASSAPRSRFQHPVHATPGAPSAPRPAARPDREPQRLASPQCAGSASGVRPPPQPLRTLGRGGARRGAPLGAPRQRPPPAHRGEGGKGGRARQAGNREHAQV